MGNSWVSKIVHRKKLGGLEAGKLGGSTAFELFYPVE
jgi:hypothetical protein